jgi:ribosomal-protein-alanine N-acetyltransferase
MHWNLLLIFHPSDILPFCTLKQVMRMNECALPLPIVTPRLIIRDAVRSDMRSCAALYRSPKVRKHLNGPLKRTAEEWWAGHQRGATNVDRLLCIVQSGTNEFVGTCGFLKTQQQHEWETWLLLRSKFWGAGIGAEVTSALIAAAFSSLAALRVIGIVDPTNHASVRMIKRLGFAFVEEDKGATWQQGHHVYSVEPHTHNPAVIKLSKC